MKVDVDSGQLIIVDPCHILSEDKYNKLPRKISEFVADGNANGVLINGFGGDGSYDVEVKKENGLVKEVIIKF